MKTKYYEYLLISIFILILIGIIFNIGLYSESLLAQRPFESSVWGNFADFLTLLITIITSIFLIRTFNAQYKLNNLMFKQHEMAILPAFSIKVEKDESFIVLYGNHAQRVCFIKLINGEQITRKINFITCGEKVGSEFLHLTNVINGNYKAYETYFFFKRMSIDPNSNNEAQRILKVQYYNMDNVLYQQILEYSDGALNFCSPERISIT